MPVVGSMEATLESDEFHVMPTLDPFGFVTVAE
jgi:hypothetical protein